MQSLSRSLIAAGALALAASNPARADIPDLSAFQSSSLFTATSSGMVSVTYLFARAEYSNDLVLFVAVGGTGTTLISIPGNMPNVGVGSPLSTTFSVTAGQTMLFGICSSGNTGSPAPACPTGWGAYYMGPGTNNNDGLVHAAILTGAQWNTFVASSGCLSEVPPCYNAGTGTTVIGFEDLPNLSDPTHPGLPPEPDFNDAVFAFDFSQVGTTVVVPEPGTMSLLALGLVGLSGAGFIRRRSGKLPLQR